MPEKFTANRLEVAGPHISQGERRQEGRVPMSAEGVSQPLRCSLRRTNSLTDDGGAAPARFFHLVGLKKRLSIYFTILHWLGGSAMSSRENACTTASCTRL